MARRYGFHSGTVKCRRIELSKDEKGGSAPQIYCGSGTPAMTASKGSIFIDYAATLTTARMFINTDGAATWAYFTASA